MLMLCQILIIDDDEIIRDMVAERIVSQFRDIELAQACCGRDAMAIILNNRSIDCIITDLNMPDGTGLDVVNFLNQESLAIPTIIYTGSDLQPYMAYLRPPVVLLCAKTNFELLDFTLKTILNAASGRS